MNCTKANSAFVVWTACFLWLTSIFAIAWSMVLFLGMGDLLVISGTHIVNAIVLLSGLMMLPTNVHMLYSIANCRTIDRSSSVGCCPLWLCISWGVAINITGAALCLKKICCCKTAINSVILEGISNYRAGPRQKQFMDNLQWSLKCCGLNSYKDWFSQDWHDKIRDYDWEPDMDKHTSSFRGDEVASDSVPLSCCKSGSCISNFLTELGTHSINTEGCAKFMHRVVMASLVAHFLFFIIVAILQLVMLKKLCSNQVCRPCSKTCESQPVYCMKDIMRARENFDASSCSYQNQPEDSDDA